MEDVRISANGKVGFDGDISGDDSNSGDIVMRRIEISWNGCIEQVDGLFRDSLYSATPELDDEGRLRADQKELDPEVQAAVGELWSQINTDTLRDLSDFAGYKREFLQLFGFEVDGVDYEADVSPLVPIENMA